MSLTFRMQNLDQADLVLLVSPEGLVEWSAHRDRDQVVTMLRDIADAMERGTL